MQERLTSFLHHTHPAEVKPFFRDDALFPLGEPWFAGAVGEAVEVRPRDVLSWAAQRWRNIQNRIGETGGEAWLKSWQVDSARPLEPLTAEQIGAVIDREDRRKTH